MSARPESVAREMERLVNQRRSAMLTFAKSKGVLPEDQAEDCVSAAVVKFFQNYDHTIGVLPVTYLYTLMKSAVFDWKRKTCPFTRVANKPKLMPVIGLSEEAIESMAVVNSDPFRQYDSAVAAQQKLKRLSRSLTANQAVVLRHMLGGVSLDESAKALGLSVNRISQLRARVKQKALEAGVCS